MKINLCFLDSTRKRKRQAKERKKEREAVVICHLPYLRFGKHTKQRLKRYSRRRKTKLTRNDFVFIDKLKFVCVKEKETMCKMKRNEHFRSERLTSNKRERKREKYSQTIEIHNSQKTKSKIKHRLKTFRRRRNTQTIHKRIPEKRCSCVLLMMLVEEKRKSKTLQRFFFCLA